MYASKYAKKDLTIVRYVSFLPENGYSVEYANYQTKSNIFCLICIGSIHIYLHIKVRLLQIIYFKESRSSVKAHAVQTSHIV